MIFMGDGSSKERHKSITEELVDGAFITVDGIERQFEEPVQQGMHGLRSDALGNRGRIRQVTEEYGDLFPFPFKGTPGSQNFLGKVFGCVGQGFACLVSGCCSDRVWRERKGRGGLLTGPDQNSVILINGKPFCLNQVDLQVFDVVIIQVKSALQGSVGDALLPLKQLDDLGDKRIIVHGRYSTALAFAVLYP